MKKIKIIWRPFLCFALILFVSITTVSVQAQSPLPRLQWALLLSEEIDTYQGNFGHSDDYWSYDDYEQFVLLDTLTGVFYKSVLADDIVLDKHFERLGEVKRDTTEEGTYLTDFFTPKHVMHGTDEFMYMDSVTIMETYSAADGAMYGKQELKIASESWLKDMTSFCDLHEFEERLGWETRVDSTFEYDGTKYPEYENTEFYLLADLNKDQQAEKILFQIREGISSPGFPNYMEEMRILLYEKVQQAWVLQDSINSLDAFFKDDIHGGLEGVKMIHIRSQSYPILYVSLERGFRMYGGMQSSNQYLLITFR